MSKYHANTRGAHIYRFDEEVRLKRQNRRMADRRIKRARLWRAVFQILSLVIGSALLFGIVWQTMQAGKIRMSWIGIRHLVAAPNCAAARLMLLAPAKRGEPGYWPSHDADHDGIACEPWQR